jgi:hypothetical protein
MPLRQVASCFAAFAFAALFAAIPLAIVFSIDANLHRFAGRLSLIFGIVLVHAIVLGLPLFLVLRHYGWINAFSSVGAGFLVGATGILFFQLDNSTVALAPRLVMSHKSSMACLLLLVGSAISNCLANSERLEHLPVLSSGTS